ncbi:hypothetical protein AArc1_5113 (plasmid) [Natrarchaeobaculum sulfurireducens]|uniref:Uncharacterized protein n=1 Tax=Natrarchaeobaculum sulfurireducens TaxID=2044521 RepID=A0A346P9W9_9EURY|nr:hypothetical protein AArc1_5113 [Natrarchaeobaculum sulfurireducens]
MNSGLDDTPISPKEIISLEHREPIWSGATSQRDQPKASVSGRVTAAQRDTPND